MSKEDMIKVIDETTEPGTSSVIVYTQDYIYCLVSKDPSAAWKEAVFEFPDSFSVKEIPPDKALLLLIEELTKGLPGYFKEIPIVKNPGEINKVKDMVNKGSA